MEERRESEEDRMTSVIENSVEIKSGIACICTHIKERNMLIAITLVAIGFVGSTTDSLCKEWDFNGDMTLVNPGISFSSTFSGASLIFPELHKCASGQVGLPAVCGMSFADAVESGASATVDCNDCITGFLSTYTADVVACVESCGETDCADDCDKPLLSLMALQCNLRDPYTTTTTGEPSTSTTETTTAEVTTGETATTTSATQTTTAEVTTTEIATTTTTAEEIATTTATSATSTEVATTSTAADGSTTTSGSMMVTVRTLSIALVGVLALFYGGI